MIWVLGTSAWSDSSLNGRIYHIYANRAFN
jgi:hypothetical protein